MRVCVSVPVHVRVGDHWPCQVRQPGHEKTHIPRPGPLTFGETLAWWRGFGSLRRGAPVPHLETPVMTGTSPGAAVPDAPPPPCTCRALRPGLLLACPCRVWAVSRLLCMSVCAWPCGGVGDWIQDVLIHKVGGGGRGDLADPPPNHKPKNFPRGKNGILNGAKNVQRILGTQTLFCPYTPPPIPTPPRPNTKHNPGLDAHANRRCGLHVGVVVCIAGWRASLGTEGLVAAGNGHRDRGQAGRTTF